MNLNSVESSGGSGLVCILCSTGRGLDLCDRSQSFAWLKLGFSIESCKLMWV